MSPTANTSPSKPTTAKKPASKASGAKRASTAGKKPASARNATIANARANTGTIGTVGSYAERAVLIPVGAALIARDKLAAGVNELPRDPATANAKAAAQLRKFERRGTSARNGLEREARRTRVRLERELRKRRGDLDRTVSDLDKRRNSLTGKVQDRLPGVRKDRAA
jgi:hypothetical protein